MTSSWMRHKNPTLNPPDCSNSGDLKPGQDARCWVINSVQLPASYNRTAVCILIFAGLGFFKQTSTGVHYMSCVLAWVFFPFLWFSAAQNPGLKLQELVLLQLVCTAPEEPSCCCVSSCAVSPWHKRCPAPASFGEGGAEEEIWHLEPKKSPKFTCLSPGVS